MSTDKVVVALYIILMMAILVGWVLNIVIFATSVSDLSKAETILRVVGIFVAPLGGVLGYF